jgi:hypothetical protein
MLTYLIFGSKHIYVQLPSTLKLHGIIYMLRDDYVLLHFLRLYIFSHVSTILPLALKLTFRERPLNFSTKSSLKAISLNS